MVKKRKIKSLRLMYHKNGLKTFFRSEKKEKYKLKRKKRQTMETLQESNNYTARGIPRTEKKLNAPALTAVEG